MVYWIAHFFFRVFFESFLSLKAFGREKIPKQGGYVIASNHLSNLDPMLLGVAANRMLNFIAKDSLFKNKIFSFFLSQFRAFPLKRGFTDTSSIKEAIKRLKASQGVVMFPQGGRRLEGLNPEDAKPGVGLLATKAGVPIIPTFICGSDKAMPPKTKFIKMAKVMVLFGDPIWPDEKDSYRDIAKKTMISIKDLSLQI